MLKLLQTKHYIMIGVMVAAILTVYSQYNLYQLEKSKNAELRYQLVLLSKDFNDMYQDLTFQFGQLKIEQQKTSEELVKTMKNSQQKFKEQKHQIFVKLNKVEQTLAQAAN